MALSVQVSLPRCHLSFETYRKLPGCREISCIRQLAKARATEDGTPKLSYFQRWASGPRLYILATGPITSRAAPSTCTHPHRTANSLPEDPRPAQTHDVTRSPFSGIPSIGDRITCARAFILSSVHQVAPAFVGLAAALVLSLSSAPSACAEEMQLTITFPSSGVDHVSSVQRTLVEAWGIVEETFWDPTFNHQNWEEKLSGSLTNSFALESGDSGDSGEAAYSEIKAMLASLGDPFTRIVTPQEYQNFRINNDGALEGVGLLIASEPDTGRLIVLSPIEGGPAARAGIHEGDELIGIDGEKLAGLNGEQAATRLRGPAGSEVLLTVSEKQEASSLISDLTQVRLQRETIILSPVYSTMLPHTDEAGNNSNSGYIRLTTFSQGGLVRAGLDIAEMWLEGDATIVNTVDRAGAVHAVGMRGNRAMTDKPLAVLVNAGSASASEILAGALHDNGRAKLVGDSEHTYGKGKIQSVFELGDGSALFVTVAKYLSPALHQIDQVGIAPDMACFIRNTTTNDSKPQPMEVAMPVAKGSVVPIRKALIMEPDSVAQLQGDLCILTAEHELDRVVTQGQQQRQL